MGTRTRIDGKGEGRGLQGGQSTSAVVSPSTPFLCPSDDPLSPWSPPTYNLCYIAFQFFPVPRTKFLQVLRQSKPVQKLLCCCWFHIRVHNQNTRNHQRLFQSRQPVLYLQGSGSPPPPHPRLSIFPSLSDNPHGGTCAESC